MKIVTFNGGNGGYILLSGLKKYPVDITAVIGVFDSGGSTGKLRKEFGGIAIGDLRRGFLALGSDRGPRSMLKELSAYRFSSGSVNGHCLGNFILLSLGINKSVENIRKAEKFFGFRPNHHVLPPSLDDCELCAELENGMTIEGETNIDVPKHDTKIRISRVFLKPEAQACAETLKEIESADVIVIGPGDLYSSLMQNFLVKGVPEAVKKSVAKKIYVANTMTKLGETENFRVSDFLKEIQKYAGFLPDYVIVNGKTSSGIENAEKLHTSFVDCDEEELNNLGVKIVSEDVLDESRPDLHDSEKLAKAVMGCLNGSGSDFGGR